MNLGCTREKASLLQNPLVLSCSCILKGHIQLSVVHLHALWIYVELNLCPSHMPTLSQGGVSLVKHEFHHQELTLKAISFHLTRNVCPFWSEDSLKMLARAEH